MGLITMKRAAKLLGIGKQGVSFLLKKKRLIGSKDYHKLKGKPLRKRWLIDRKEITKYLLTKYKREETTGLEGHKVFSSKEGRLSVEMAAKYGHIPVSNLYYAIRHRQIAYSKVGFQYVLQEHDVENYSKKYWGVRVETEI